jgi:aromatic-L-amino-acid/L-tryptophan decarboxylase
VRERPIWKKPSAFATRNMQSTLPIYPQEPESVYEDFLMQVLPFNVNNIHPRFWAWVQGSGTPAGMLADMLASGMNTNVSIGDHMPMYVERQVLEWSKEIFGFPATAGGILTSGASIANITALVVARNHFNGSIKEKGLRSVPSQLTVYGSVETHNCLLKAVEVIGIGSENFRKVPVDSQYRMRLDTLIQMIDEDRRGGNLPFCVIGNAGTVNTGAIDDLKGISEIARDQGLWFHVDGAFGAIPKILPEFNDQLKWIEDADSVAFDFHKWFYVNYEVGCLLIKDASIQREAFAYPVSYLAKHERGLSGGPDPFSNYGMELSRGFKALKVWMLLKEHGLQKYANLIRQNISQAQYLGSLIEEGQDLELLAAISLNIVCFRFNPGNLLEEEINRLNKEILMRLQEEGIAAPSYTLLHGKYAIRVAITNHRSKREDFDALIEATRRIGKKIISH